LFVQQYSDSEYYLLNAPKKELGLSVASSMENTGDENSLK
jgi:hypothetical protein